MLRRRAQRERANVSRDCQLGKSMGHKLHCMMCGREKFDPETVPEQEFYLCWDCAKFWFADYLRRLKARFFALLPWNRR
jgi:hypothetical protein